MKLLTYQTPVLRRLAACGVFLISAASERASQKRPPQTPPLCCSLSATSINVWRKTDNPAARRASADRA